MPTGRSGEPAPSSTTPPPTHTLAYTRTSDAEDLPHATKRRMADFLRKFEAMYDYDQQSRKPSLTPHLCRFTVTPQRMRMIVEAFKDSLELGLAKPAQVVPMIPTYVFGWPSGNETGNFLAVDLGTPLTTFSIPPSSDIDYLGGTNLRVCLVNLSGGGKFEITQSKYRLTEEQKQEDGQKLFDFCAECLRTFIDANVETGLIQKATVLPLGFTFSYPCSQERIDHGILIRWTKGFGSPNTEGHNVVEMFRESLAKHSVPAEVVALTCDTTGTLIASHYVNIDTKIACIFGTGCNAAYMERVADIPKISHLKIDPEAQMAINCEWGAFDSFEHEHLPRTKYDIIIDEASNKPGEQAFEVPAPHPQTNQAHSFLVVAQKLISGRYLGEILRLIICELIDEGVVFLGQNTYKIEIPYSFDTAFLSLMESDPTDELLMVIGIFTYFFALETTLAERQFFRALAKLVGKRAARLSSCGIAAIVKKMGYLERGCAVGADGSLYNKYPGFPDRIHEGLQDIFGIQGKKIVTYHAEDGSGIGSAIVAAMTKARKDAGLYATV
ncbi:hypothetical protein NLI96_g12110 [Meripilus lineatus]|uniref:Phosphotransferase n=1 Tax=Meripilus lineatus TaxID=2056292 RepID=A0AAD5URX7_9APHY|nr:hypothetical protein NLI96_g12110 [Physisporinus lineatus]